MKLEDSLPSYKLQVTAFLCINYIIDHVCGRVFLVFRYVHRVKRKMIIINYAYMNALLSVNRLLFREKLKSFIFSDLY